MSVKQLKSRPTPKKRPQSGTDARGTRDARREYEAKLNAVSRSMATIEFTTDGIILDVNEIFLQVMGYSRAEVVGQQHKMFVDPAYGNSSEYRDFWASLRSGAAQTAEFRRLAKGGKEVFLQASYSPIIDSHGTPYKIVKYALDVTAQKRASLNAQGQMQAISRSMATIEFALDGTILEANDNFLAAMGYQRGEVVGRHHRMFVDPSYAESAEYREFWQNLGRGQAQTAEFRRIGKGGREVFIQASYNPILDAQGKAWKVVKYATDLTEQKRLAAASELERTRMLAESLRAKSALDGSTINVMIVDDKFDIVYLNESMRQLMTTHEHALARDIPQFRVDALIGNSFDRFHRDPRHQRQLLADLRENHKVRLNIGGRIIDQVIVAARSAADTIIGYSVEWVDQTDLISAQADVEKLLKAAIDGDLTQRLEVSHYHGFVRQISEGMNRLLDSVSDSFRHVKVAVEQIGQAGNELRTTSQMMSSSSVQLNRAAEESSTSLAKASEMVRANAENAAMANQLVTQTSSAAQDGQARMHDMSGAMSEINASAQQIAKIIKVIDEIAFQTNLLALNAAVEAARAGRHGKGFAVVAQEVRNLAERSAKAAKETAQLIEDSVAKVGQGVRIANDTRGALEVIIGNVAKVVDLAGEIATASDEQSRTLESVSESMGQVTESAQAGSQQSNEVAAAAEEMGRQMEVLKQRIDAYKLANVSRSMALPAGVTPELLEQITALLIAQGMMSGGSPRGAAPVHNDNGHGHAAAPAAPRLAATGTSGQAGDPRAVLPLDRDERGFHGF